MDSNCEVVMSTQDQARALMIRHNQMIKNREQCMLSRAAERVGMPAEAGEMWSYVHNRTHVASSVYDRSQASLS